MSGFIIGHVRTTTAGILRFYQNLMGRRLRNSPFCKSHLPDTVPDGYFQGGASDSQRKEKDRALGRTGLCRKRRPAGKGLSGCPGEISYPLSSGTVFNFWRRERDRVFFGRVATCRNFSEGMRREPNKNTNFEA